VSYYKMPILEETGYAVLDSYGGVIDPSEWMSLEYVDWKSSGDTRFAPIASAQGEIGCNAFWHSEPPRCDKDGIWIDSQVAKAPTLVERVKEVDARVGRCRVIELQANTYADALYNMHRDDNNRLNPEGTGWIVRAFFNLTDNPDSLMVLREDRDDPSTETRIPLPAGAQVVIDTQRLWHAVWHPGPEPRYCLITSYTSGPGLDAWIASKHGVDTFDVAPLDPAFADEAEAAAQKKRDDRAAALAAQGTNPTFGDGSLQGGPAKEVLSEA